MKCFWMVESWWRVYMIQKSSRHNRRCSKIVEADVIRQKFPMQFELPNRNRVANDDITITNRSRIMFESRCVNELITRSSVLFSSPLQTALAYASVSTRYESVSHLPYPLQMLGTYFHWFNAVQRKHIQSKSATTL